MPPTSEVKPAGCSSVDLAIKKGSSAAAFSSTAALSESRLAVGSRTLDFRFHCASVPCIISFIHSSIHPFFFSFSFSFFFCWRRRRRQEEACVHACSSFRGEKKEGAWAITGLHWTYLQCGKKILWDDRIGHEPGCSWCTLYARVFSRLRMVIWHLVRRERMLLLLLWLFGEPRGCSYGGFWIWKCNDCEKLVESQFRFMYQNLSISVSYSS